MPFAVQLPFADTQALTGLTNGCRTVTSLATKPATYSSA